MPGMLMSTMSASGIPLRISMIAACPLWAATTLWPSSANIALSVKTVSGSSSTMTRRNDRPGRIPGDWLGLVSLVRIYALPFPVAQSCVGLGRTRRSHALLDEIDKVVRAERLHQAGHFEDLGAAREMLVPRDQDHWCGGQRGICDELRDEFKPPHFRQPSIHAH